MISTASNAGCLRCRARGGKRGSCYLMISHLEGGISKGTGLMIRKDLLMFAVVGVVFKNVVGFYDVSWQIVVVVEPCLSTVPRIYPASSVSKGH